MSSKSKNKKPQTEVLPAEESEVHAEEVIHAPKGTNPLRFALMVALVILLLVIFTIPSAMFGAIGGGGQNDEVYLTWERPGHGTVEVGGLEFQQKLRDWTTFYSILFSGGRSIQVSNEQMAGLMILGALAEDAGIRVPDAELKRALRDFVLPRFENTNQYKAYMNGRRGYSTLRFENSLRDYLRTTTYLSMMGYLGGRVAPTAISDAWAEQHVEAQYDYVQVDVSDFADTARSQVPGDEELDAWLQALPPFEASAFRQPMRTSLEQLRIGMDADASVLLAAFPRPEGEDAEVRAREYYDSQLFKRFFQPMPADLDEEARGNWVSYPEYEDVAEKAAAEAPLWLALSDLRDELERRQSEGETLDMVGLAAEYGVEFGPAGEPRTVEDWIDDEEWGGAHLNRVLGMVQQGGFSPEPSWDGDAWVVARVAEKTDPLLELAPVRDEVVDAWVAKRSDEMALELLGGMRDGLRAEDAPEGDITNPEAEGAAFRAAAENVGRSVSTTEWLDRADRSALPEGTPPIRLFLRTGPFRFLEPGAVGEPGTAGDPRQAFLVRVAAERPSDISNMKPGDYPRLLSTVVQENNQAFQLANFAMAPTTGASPIPDFTREDLAAQFAVEFTESDEDDLPEDEDLDQ